jgi:hypothetical protein
MTSGQPFVTLATCDAHDLYKKVGFTQDENIAKRFMCKRNDGGELNACLGKGGSD